MTTPTDIGNRALQMLGSRTTMASLSEASNEAIQINLVYNAIVQWAFSTTNWNFARATLPLTLNKQIQLPTGTWSNSSPQPPWLYSYVMPINFVRAIYLTNSANTAANYVGEPQRYVIGVDIVPFPSGTNEPCIFTNASPAILVYTYRHDDPTQWTGLFERFAVAALANAVALQLTGNMEVVAHVKALMTEYFQLAEAQNVAEELLYTDVTPEWIQAIGIKYPMRRYGPTGPILKPQEVRGQNDQRR